MQTTEKPYNAEHAAGERISPPDVGAAPLSRELRSYQPKRPSKNMASSPKLPSERRFGGMLTAAFAILGIYQIIRHRSWIAWVGCLTASIVFGFFTLVAPKALAPLNRLWFRLGELLGKIVSPIVLGIIFFGILTPLSLVTRLFGRDELRLKRRAVNSYWIDRPSTDAEAQSFKNQF